MSFTPRLALAAMIAACACASGEAQFQVRQVPDLPNTPLAVSLLGAYDDGQMNEAVGTDFASDVSRALGTEPCVPGFDEQLEAANPEGFAAVEAEAESRGIDDELLRMIAPAAKGDVILALDMSGRLMTGEDEPAPRAPSSKPKASPTDPDPSQPHRGAGFGRHSRHGAEPRSTPHAEEGQPIPDLEVAASFYSVRQQRTVSSVTMRYSGSSLDDGLRQLAQKLATLYPHTVCRAWNWQHVRVVHEQDSAGLPLPLFHLVRTSNQ
jgi:hypothetical protein